MDADLFFAKIAAEHMAAYLDSDVLFYPIDNLMVVSTAALHGINVPQLSIGAWLEAVWRLSARTLVPSDNAQLAAYRASVAAIRQKKGEVYGQKARREFKSRLDTWSWYLDDPKSAGR
ncbi:MAG: hypothetical protein KIH69_007075 [Anaerolineae bacterium]|nr:hypothetical protein [Anaerolineae bacterium]